MLQSTRDHLQEAGESYFEHLRFAALVGAMLVGAGVACLLHGLLPGLCRRTASGIVRQVCHLMSDRTQLKQVAHAASGTLVLVGLLLLGAGPAVQMIGAGLQPLTLASILLLAGLPIAYLSGNPDLEPVA